ncbi:MAG: DMT family transporter [Pseudomonadota bacterium]|nr:DMT family transporter [Pseudomonadota bacterium]
MTTRVDVAECGTARCVTLPASFRLPRHDGRLSSGAMTDLAQGSPTERVRTLAVFFGLVMCWGLLWPTMKIAVSEIPILPFRSITSLLSASAMVVITLACGHSLRVPRDQWRALVIAGVFNVAAWLYFSAVGVSLLPAGRAALIAYTMPVWAFLMGIPLLGERVTTWRIIGLLLAMGGLAVLMGDDIVRLGEAPVGALVMVCAALAFAFGTVWQKHVQWRIAHLPMLTWQLIIGTVPMTLLALPEFGSIGAVSWQAIAATLYAGLIAQVFGLGAYLWLVRRLPVKTSSLSMLLVPVCGLGASAILLGERLGLAELIACGLILAAIGTALAGGGTPQRR